MRLILSSAAPVLCPIFLIQGLWVTKSFLNLPVLSTEETPKKCLALTVLRRIVNSLLPALNICVARCILASVYAYTTTEQLFIT